MTNKILMAAIKLPNSTIGTITPPGRHSDIWSLLEDADFSTTEIAQGVQGFIEANGDFKTREEAYIIAKEAGQIIKRDDVTETIGTLYTEDLW